MSEFANHQISAAWAYLTDGTPPATVRELERRYPERYLRDEATIWNRDGDPPVPADQIEGLLRAALEENTP